METFTDCQPTGKRGFAAFYYFESKLVNRVGEISSIIAKSILAILDYAIVSYNI